MTISKQFALISYSKAKLEDYNPSIMFESDSVEELEEKFEDYDDGPTQGYDIIEKTSEGLKHYYTGESFNMPSY
jgi:hypothetical protein